MDWPHWTLHGYIERGILPVDWGGEVQIPLREGQHVSMVCAAPGSGDGLYLGLVNHDANRYWSFGNTNALNRKYKLERIGLKPALISAIVFLILAAISIVTKTPLKAGGYVAGAGSYGSFHVPESTEHVVARNLVDVGRSVGLQHKEVSMVSAAITFVILYLLAAGKVKRLHNRLDRHVNEFVSDTLLSYANKVQDLISNQWGRNH